MNIHSQEINQVMQAVQRAKMEARARRLANEIHNCVVENPGSRATIDAALYKTRELNQLLAELATPQLVFED